VFEHEIGCEYARESDGGHSDASKRVSDTYMLHRIANPHAVGKWIAVRVADGTSDQQLYDTRRDAVRHQKHAAKWCAYIRIAPCDMSVCDAASFLRSSRLAVEASGALLSDPDREIIRPLTREQYYTQCADLAYRTGPITIGKRK
jgi:hypothetical protein